MLRDTVPALLHRATPTIPPSPRLSPECSARESAGGTFAAPPQDSGCAQRPPPWEQARQTLARHPVRKVKKMMPLATLVAEVLLARPPMFAASVRATVARVLRPLGQA